jgi:hypothetical protein
LSQVVDTFLNLQLDTAVQIGKNANGVLFVAVALAVALGSAASNRGLEDRTATGNAKLVSMEELPDTEKCVRRNRSPH